jgi:type I restriction enzyme M protein
MHPPETETETRIAIVFNGSPLFTGDAGSGESEIRRWIIENDWLEAIIALPDQLFYNTNINTYLWILSSVKEQEGRGKVILIDARDMFVEMKKSLGQKRKEISDEQIKKIKNRYISARDGEKVKIFDNEEFGYRKITIDRPLRMKIVISEEGVSKVSIDKAFEKIKNGKQKTIDPQSQTQDILVNLLSKLKGMEFRTKSEFEEKLSPLFLSNGLKLSAAQRKALLKIFGVRDENAEISTGLDGKPEADTDLRDYENIPLKEDIHVYFNREVKPFVADAWINESVRDIKDGKVGKVGYEIPFNRYFYKFVPPRPLEEIDADLKKLGNEIIDLLKEVTE